MRIIKKIFLITTIFAVSVPAILVVFGLIYQDEIVEEVKSELNKQLSAEIRVNQIEFSLLSGFPMASVNMYGISGFESSNYSSNPDTLFHFKTISLSFSIFDLLANQFILKSITIKQGRANLLIDKSGRENFAIIQFSDTDSSDFFLDLQQVKLENCSIGFRDFRTHDLYSFYFPKIVAKGTFSDTQITTALLGQTRVDVLELNGTRYLTDEAGKLDIGIEVNLETGEFKVLHGYITLRQKYRFEVKGNSKDGKYFYTFNAIHLDLHQAETLIPKKHISFINTYAINGTSNIYIELKKKNKTTTHPSITGTFDVWDGYFSNKNTKHGVEITKAKGRFDLGKNAGPATTQIWVDVFHFQSKEGEVEGEFTMNNLNHPRFRIVTSGNANLTKLSQLLGISETMNMRGKAIFSIRATGVIHQIDTITPYDIKKIKGTAKITLQDAYFSFRDIPNLNGINTEIKLNQDYMVVSNFSGLIAGSKTELGIKLQNWLGYVTDSSEKLFISGSLKTDKINFIDWTTAEKVSQPFSLPKNIYFNGYVNASKVIHQKTELDHFTGFIQTQPDMIRVREARFSSFGGDFYTDLSMRLMPDEIKYEASIRTRNVDVSELLKTYHNFGQASVTYKHLRGKLNSKIEISFTSDRSFNIDNSGILAEADIVLLRGEMIENKLLTSIPAEIKSNSIIGLFVNLDALEQRLHHIKFDTISNHFSIANKILTVPQMHIASTALNIDLKGTHTFDNKIDYYLSFSLKEVLTKKQIVTSDYGYIHDDRNGNRLMFLHIYTKDGKIEVDLDREGKKRYRQSRTSMQVKTAKSVLKEELGMFKSDTTLSSTRKESMFEFEVDLGEFTPDTILTIPDTTIINTDTIKIKKRKKKKTKKEKNVDDWDFEDDY